ncbi:MAG TPA: mycofactocin-coupled SDR family oxidoreductase [Euzebyales bacterium]|nr:mycofactocin-coupled SDR family oxidoreductase [Euzebyales bacterium]
MAGRVEGKVALITGAARGQGRSHAVRLAEEGADIIALDVCEDIETSVIPLASEDDLAETAKLVEDLDRRIMARKADVRDLAALESVVQEGVSEFGRMDIVSANAGIAGFGPAHELTEQQWEEMLAVNITGVWKTCRAVMPAMIEAGNGGSIILTSSTAGLMGLANTAHYTAAKHGVVGLMRTLANELAPHMIRVNSVHPTAVATDMIHNEATYGLFRPDLEHPTLDDAKDAFMTLNMLPIPWVEARDISNAVLWLASDEARYVTGVALPVDAGSTQR